MNISELISKVAEKDKSKKRITHAAIKQIVEVLVDMETEARESGQPKNSPGFVIIAAANKKLKI